MAKKRSYKMQKRAESRDETRQRIVEATAALHEEIGPRATSIKAIAERAGVQRLTVYRHFPDETAVFKACTQHWLAQHPPPEVADWGDIDDPLEKALSAIHAFQSYYQREQRMWTASYQDVEQVPALQGPMAEFSAYLDQLVEELTGAFAARGKVRQALRMTLRHLVDFPAWLALERNGVGNKEKLALAKEWLPGVLG